MKKKLIITLIVFLSLFSFIQTGITKVNADPNDVRTAIAPPPQP